ncbi:MAG: DinB family protein, partial [Planctomycetota bacterium]
MSDKNAFQTVATALGEYVERCTPALRELSTADAAASRGEGKWTRIQILGHLIDSAANNHQRFIRAQESTEELVFPKYEQDHWVSVQGYSGAEWSSVVSLWEQYNL